MQRLQPSRFLVRRPLLAIGLAAILAAGFWSWRIPAPLSSEEQQLVGVWTPSNSTNEVQLIFELRSDRTLVRYNRHVSDGPCSRPDITNWMLDGEFLVFQRFNPNYFRQLALSLTGSPRRKRVSECRIPYFGVEADTFLTKGQTGREIPFVRLALSELESE